LVEISEKKVPELNDEWVKANFTPQKPEGEEQAEDKAEEQPDQPESEIIDTVEKLRERVRSAMEKQAQSAADAEAHDKLFSQVVEKASVSFPEVMVEEEVHSRLHDLTDDLEKRKVTLDDYLKYRDETREDLQARLQEEARKYIKAALVIGEVIKKEDLKVEEEDAKAEARRIAEERGVPVETMLAYLDRTDGWQSIRNRVLHQKAMDFLVHASNIKNVSG
jgi:trigger factor